MGWKETAEENSEYLPPKVIVFPGQGFYAAIRIFLERY
jgi:hypothetical protein